MPGTAVIGCQFGDEGKGKIVDVLAAESDLVVRFNGGANAGHTVQVGSDSFAFRLLPSGIIRPNVLNVIGNGVVVDPGQLLEEIDGLRQRGYAVENLRVSDRAHVVMPWHKALDTLEEGVKGGMAAETTKRGIGPAFEDKVGRWGIRVTDILDPIVLRKKLESYLPAKHRIILALGGTESFVLERIFNQYREFATRLQEFVADAGFVVHEALANGKSVLFEGAQGTHLDVDHGIYPYGTSSNCVAAAACVGSGVGPAAIGRVIGVVKAFTSRVGAGPFPTELDGKEAEYLRERGGGEYGTVTRRPRRVGWLDLVMVRLSARVNGLTDLAVTKLDVLGGLETVPVAFAYDHYDEELRAFPANMHVLAECNPVYEELTGWEDLPPEEWRRIAANGFGALPKEAQAYVRWIEKELGAKLAFVSVGRGREDTIDLRRTTVTPRPTARLTEGPTPAAPRSPRRSAKSHRAK
ncbi:MAG: adenylosuccinate synthase [Methanobacteriota archaeon]|nr:MAG: adenylosuccinate synthase [Euryarchaeota archaeon]